MPDCPKEEDCRKRERKLPPHSASLSALGSWLLGMEWRRVKEANASKHWPPAPPSAGGTCPKVNPWPPPRRCPRRPTKQTESPLLHPFFLPTLGVSIAVNEVFLPFPQSA